MDFADCLPVHLRGPHTKIERLTPGMSGAGVFRVEAGGKTYFLKVSTKEPVEQFRRKLEIRQLVSQADIAPRVVHADEHHRAVLSEFIVDRSFFALWGDAKTRTSTIVKLGKTLRAAHDVTFTEDVPELDPRGTLTMMWSGLAGFTVPSFVRDAVRRVLAEEVPETDRANVLSHNDVNPTNLAYDGDRLVLLDWDAAGANEPFYDLASIAVFLRMDDAMCKQLIAAHDGRPVDHLPERFIYDRKIVSVLAGVGMLRSAQKAGHAGGDGELGSTMSLLELYQKLRAGTVGVASADDQWAFGLALIKTSLH